MSERSERTSVVEYTSAENKRTTNVNVIVNSCCLLMLKQLLTTTYFFCLTAISGTEGIKPLKNFVPLLAPYRAFFATFVSKAVRNNVVYTLS